MELDLICPRPPRLICTPFSTATHVLSKTKKNCTVHSGCYGILSYNNLTSRWRKTVFICCLTLWKRWVMRSYIHSHLIFVKACSVFFPPFSSSSCKTGNQVCIISVLLVSFCIHYPAEYLHLLCIPAVQSKLQFLTQQPKSDTMSGFIGAFIWLSRSSFCE